MNLLDPVLGTVTGLEPGQLSAIVLFTLKALLFCLPFLLIAFAVEKDIHHVPILAKAVKIFILAVFVTPILSFAVFNYMAPGFPESFWKNHQVLQTFWIMEGPLAPSVLAGICILYFLLYAAEVIQGDLRG